MFTKRHIKIVVLSALALALAFVFVTGAKTLTKPDNAAAAEYTCPAGQTPIGGGECRIEVTGCPWADSIPKDSEKCVPPETNNNSTQPNNNNQAPVEAVPKCTGAKQ